MLGSLMMYSCSKIDGAGPVVIEEIPVAAFGKLKLEVPATVYFTPGQQKKLEIEAQQNIINLIKTEVINGELVLSLRNNTNIHRHQPINIYVDAPALSALSAYNGKIEVFDLWKPETLSLIIGGSGDIFIRRVQTQKLLGRIDGSGKIMISGGFTNSSDLNISGSGLMDLENLPTDSVYSKISGSGTVKISVKEYLQSDISGSGTVMYKGNPVVNSKVSGSGTVVKL